ncbi:PilZ domain-containing protein [Methylobacterium gossipiicola]|uniref:PilZ domain-containing protein n=1 Tax=Methylobacterium gossipiicola TaxID=582675 RepID=UPI0015A6AB4C|nr:PilZ domain-containing protein [Methylobacterium gossipiicola]
MRCTSLDDLEILVDVAPVPLSRVVCRIPGLGVLAGRAAFVTERSFGLGLEAGMDQRRRLAARIGWHHAQALSGPDRRGTARVVPSHPGVVVRWGDVEEAGTLRDVSTGGAAVDVASRPPVGFPVTLGVRRATVVRHTETGIGVRFALPLNPENVTESVVL